MKRTLSIGSRVPPGGDEHAAGPLAAHARCASGARGARRRRRAIAASQAASSRAGSARRPTPCSPLEASRPRRARRCARRARAACARLACVAGCSYMRLFIAGASTSGQLAASAQLLSRLSARPAASLAIVLAEAGAIRYSVGVGRPAARWLSGSCVGRRLAGKGAARGVALELARRAPARRSARRTRPRRRSAGWRASARRARACPAPVARRTSSSAL